MPLASSKCSRWSAVRTHGSIRARLASIVVVLLSTSSAACAIGPVGDPAGAPAPATIPAAIEEPNAAAALALSTATVDTPSRPQPSVMPSGWPDWSAMRELLQEERDDERDLGRRPSRSSRAHPDRREGRYQVARVRGAERVGFVILDTETGVFEHWIEVADERRYKVFRCRWGDDCPWTEKRSVNRGFDP